jgi:hypothetical protein
LVLSLTGDLATGTTTVAVKAVQRVTTVDQQPIDARKPSLVSTGPLEAKGTVPDSIHHYSILLYL